MMSFIVWEIEFFGRNLVKVVNVFEIQSLPPTNQYNNSQPEQFLLGCLMNAYSIFEILKSTQGVVLAIFSTLITWRMTGLIQKNQNLFQG